MAVRVECWSAGPGNPDRGLLREFMASARSLSMSAARQTTGQACIESLNGQLKTACPACSLNADCATLHTELRCLREHYEIVRLAAVPDATRSPCWGVKCCVTDVRRT